MKEKIERFSKGDFEYELPSICLSEEEISIIVEAGKVYENSVTISNREGRRMKGVLYSSNRLLTLINPSFSDVESKITYQFNATYIKAGEIIQGEISIVSDCGEKAVPFTVQTEAPYCMTSLGKIKDLFQFANLARMDWTEAKKIFRSEDFELVFLSNEEKYKVIYRNLLKSISTSQALEEFLISIHKKSNISLNIDKTKVEYLVTDEEFMDTLILTKDHWGYAEIKVSTDAAFIKLEQKFVWADRFIGNNHQISFIIQPGNMKQGNNFGRIWIKTVHQTIVVDIVCKYHSGADKKATAIRRRQQAEFGLLENYLSFRLNKINLIKYLEDSGALLEELLSPKDSGVRDLLKAHLAIISGKETMAKQLLAGLEREEAGHSSAEVVEFCAYLYLKALLDKQEDTIKYAAETIRSYYENGHNDWRILWFLLYTDKRYEKNKSLKLADIKEQYESGCHSPILYYEAVCVYNEEPILLRELTDFELQVLNFGIKNWLLTKDVAQQYTYLANKRKNFNPVMIRGLMKLYDEYGTTEILSTICCMLIKGMKKTERYFEWYRLGVEAQLRITELYEYYVYSIDDTTEEVLPQAVLLYFIYNSSLNDKKKAFLYANIIKNKEKNEPIYRTYYKKMEVFTVKQLEAHHISSDLAVLYKEFLTKDMLNPEMANQLPYICYRNELTCNNPNITGVSVIHMELNSEETQPLSEGKAQMDIYTSNAQIFLTDTTGNRFTVSVEYSLKPLMPSEDYENECAKYCSHPMLLLHLFDRIQSYRIMTENSIFLRKQVLHLEGLKEDYYFQCLQALIDYYYENYNDTLLEYYLRLIDLHKIKPEYRMKFLEYMMIRSFYDKALEALDIFGYEGIAINRLVKLCSGWMTGSGAEKKYELMVSLCFYVFLKGKYDEAILQYLVSFYYGPTAEMYRLWQAAKGFELSTQSLEERLLVQMLFSQNDTQDSVLIFKEYYRDITNQVVVRAYLSYYAYQYLIHDCNINVKLFPIMKRELNYEENDICLLAWMKFNASNGELTENELIFIEYNIDRLVKKAIVLPLFEEFKKYVKLPERIYRQCYVEYITDPKKQVYIHYRFLKEKSNDEYTTERMSDTFMGIHVKEFVLFYHEILQYYITQEYKEEVTVTDNFELHFDKEVSEDEESKYNRINRMLMAIEMQDEKTLQELMEHYVKTSYIISKCFTTIE